MRLPKQVLVIPYIIENNNVKYVVFKRKDREVWQFIAGGVEDFDKSVLDGAKREAYEEANLSNDLNYIALEEYTKIPVKNVVKDYIWGKDIFFVEEFAFAVNIGNEAISISNEHSEFKYLNYEDAMKILRYDSNKSALWELNEKIKFGIIK